MKRSILFVLSLGFLQGFSQEKTNSNADLMLLQSTNISALNQLQLGYQQNWEKEQAIISRFAIQHQIPLFQETKDGGLIMLKKLDSNGNPIFFRTDNANASKTISTNKVQVGGISGLNLDGTGVRMGIWDGGSVRTTHTEFQPITGTGTRITQIDVPSSASQHATHVSGTILARGVDPTAKGMAINARLRAFDFNNDLTEMASEASNGMVLSNHSYGIPGGWEWNNQWYWYGDMTISTTEDYKFGYYDSEAYDWDNLARNAPYYLMVKSAGNNRNEVSSGAHKVLVNGTWTTSTARHNSDGTYDNMTGSANSKNILVIGSAMDLTNGWASASAVNISSFSSTGPTDDGRIKPDIMANGDDLRSCNNTGDATYTNMSGTSMSSPNATGSISLLQQLSRKKYGRWMRSATVKALVIHTADEAGSGEGPDYTYGWGLMNTYKASKLLSDSSNQNPILEKGLTNKDTFTLQVYTDGTKPLMATLVWTDLPGVVGSPQLNNPALKLINDLDLRFFDSLGTEYLPYVLNPSSRTSPATKGDNYRDNVEKVVINAPVAGWYTLRISHKNTLQGFQPFSLVVTGGANPPKAQVSVSNKTICVGTLVRFNDHSTTTAHTITWNFPGGNPSTATIPNPQVSYNLPGTYGVYMTITDSLNTYSFIDSSMITVVNSPKVDTLFKTPNTCSGNGSIDVHYSGGYAPYHFTWTPSLKDSSFVNGLKAGVYTVLITDSNGCSVSKTTTIAENGPIAVASVVNPIGCYGESTGSVKVQMNGGTPPFIYSWNTTPIQNSNQAVGLSKGMYRVHVIDSFGCSADTSISLIQPDSISIVVFTNPNTSVNGNGSAGASVYGGTPPYTYSWATTPPQNGNAIYNLFGGNYSLTITDAKNCTKTTSVKINGIGVGVREHEITKFQMFPTPSSGLVMLYFENQGNSETILQIQSLDGKLVHQVDLGNQTTLAKEFDFSNLENGIYLATLKTIHSEKVVKLVIQH